MDRLVHYKNGIALVDGSAYCAALRVVKSITSTQRVPPSLAENPLAAIPIGAWRLGSDGLYGCRVAQLCALDPLALLRSEDAAPFGAAIRQYARWMQAGHKAPPIEVLQQWDGRLAVSDGHRRTMAAICAGVTIRGWVAWVIATGERDADGQAMYTPLTWELAERYQRPPAVPLNPTRAPR